MTPRSRKPVRKCHACPLNMGDRCWGYASPRLKWSHDRVCPGRFDVFAHRLFETWRKQAAIKSLREIRREFIHQRPTPPIFYLEKRNAAKRDALRRTFGL